MAKSNHIILLVCAFIFLAVCDGNMDKYNEQKQQIRKVCQDKTKITTDLADSVADGTFPEGNKDLKCYIACAMEQMKSMKDGKTDKATALQMIDTAMPEHLRDGARKAMNVCSEKFDELSDPCELAWEMVKCWKSENPTFKFV